MARTAANLDTRAAKATSEGDRQMIHASWHKKTIQVGTVGSLFGRFMTFRNLKMVGTCSAANLVQVRAGSFLRFFCGIRGFCPRFLEHCGSIPCNCWSWFILTLVSPTCGSESAFSAVRSVNMVGTCSLQTWWKFESVSFLEWLSRMLLCTRQF